MSTALNSNTLNVAVGLLIPAALTGPGRPSGPTILAAVWYVGLTAVILAFAYRDRGIRRMTGVLVIAAYLVFAASILTLASPGPQRTRIAIVAGLAVASLFAGRLTGGRQPDSRGNEQAPSRPRPARRNPGAQARGTPVEVSGNGSDPESARARVAGPPQSKRGQESLLTGWPVRRLWALGLEASIIVAAIDAALGNRVILIGVLIVGPCCVLLTGRWAPTALTGLWVVSLAVLLGIPDGIWGTAIFFTWLGAVAVVALASTAAAALIQTLGPAHPR